MSESDSDIPSVEQSYHEGDSQASTHESGDESTSSEQVIAADHSHAIALEPEEEIDLLLSSELKSFRVGANRMDKQSLLSICKKQKLFETPHLNDILYLQQQGFGVIENLEPYCNIVTLFLSNNGIKRISGLSKLGKLRMLYLNSNMIHVIEGLPINLEYLNMSNNLVEEISGVSQLPLHTLILSHNRINHPISIKNLPSSITSLDLSFNTLDLTQIESIDLFPLNLTALFLQGCKVDIHRREFVARFQNLLFLDKSSVTQDERECAVARLSGGVEEEQRVRRRQEERKRIDRDSVITNFRLFQMQAIETSNMQRQDQYNDLVADIRSVLDSK